MLELFELGIGEGCFLLIIALVGWLVGFFLFWKLRTLDSLDIKRESPRRTLSVIIPARNEEQNIGKLLESLSRQKRVPEEIIVVDDNSSDRTAEIASSYGVKLVTLKSDPPSGWIGKSWACWNGYLESTGEILLFLDSDVELAPDALATVEAYLETHGGLVSAQPYHRMERLYERLSMVFNLIVVASLGDFKACSKESRGAFGPCMACYRSDYLKVGGHETIRGSVLDDLELGKAFNRNGLPVNNTFGGKLIKFRMYPGGVKSILEGWGKNFAKGAGSTPPLTLILMILWITGGFSVGLRLPFIVQHPEFLFGIVLYFAYAFQIYFYSRKIGSFSPIHALIFPVYFLFFFYTFFYSIVRTVFFKSVSWKGRDIDVGS